VNVIKSIQPNAAAALMNPDDSAVQGASDELMREGGVAEKRLQASVDDEELFDRHY